MGSRTVLFWFARMPTLFAMRWRSRRPPPLLRRLMKYHLRLELLLLLEELEGAGAKEVWRLPRPEATPCGRP